MPSGFHIWSKAAGDNASSDSAINWAEGQAPSSINDSARNSNAVLAKWRDDNNGSLTTAGSSTAYTLTTNTVFTTLALLDNQTLGFTVDETSGATPTLNVDGLGAKAIRNATGVALSTGALVAGSVYRVTYKNTAGEFLIHNQAAVLPTDSVATSSISNDAVTYAKIQNVSASSRLLGRATSGAGDAEEITLGAGLSLAGASLVSTLNPAVIPGFLSGLTLSTAGSSATFGVAVGGANDVAQGGMMALTLAYTKTTSAWAVGAAAGALDASTIASNTWYHVYLIKRIDTGVVDVLVSTSVGSPTMPTNYTLRRRIGSMKTNGSAQWTKFTQFGDKFLWEVPVVIASATYPTGARASLTLTVPTGINVNALFKVAINSTGGGNGAFITSLVAETDTTTFLDLASGGYDSQNFARITNTSGQIGLRPTLASDLFTLATYGWIDTLGK